MLYSFVSVGWRWARVLLAVLVVVGGIKLAIELGPRILSLDPAQCPANPFLQPHTVMDLLVHPPAPGRGVEVDAYFSEAGSLLSSDLSKAADRLAILSDQPFLAEFSVLGSIQANVLPDDEPWLIAAVPVEAWPLPYRARFRGHLELPAASASASAGHRIFVIERVVRTYVQKPPVPRATEQEALLWPRYQDVRAGCSLPQPPGWRLERIDEATLALYDPERPDSPVTLRIHPGETHHDPYDPTAAPLLEGRAWSIFQQGSSPGLSGYRIDVAEQPFRRTVSVLLSAHGQTCELSVRYPLGFAVPQSVLATYSAIVAGFRFNEPPGPTPTPPVRQVLGPGPFLSEREALAAVCDCLGGEIESFTARLLSEAEARRLAAQAAAFGGHYDGIWVITVNTPRAARTNTLRLFLDATNGHELYREEIAPGSVPMPAEVPSEPMTLAEVREASGRDARWIEVILDRQLVIAWEGNVAVRSMLASTGTAQHPTVRGNFRIYQKFINAPMQGPGYYLPNVPYIMYFYQGYGFHGAYWHTAFGTPMSHGCVNLSLADAAWLFDWASPQLPAGASTVAATPCNPGTLVVIH